ncbi:glycosyltransferase family 4 protein [Streptomyces sp. BE20]|uniref:glycosyltransferase family 4 protein n=1 Tax=Streptomyces sp. BE20 TaxID=3002525 RepID=UPI002E76AD08|nr:glycosyltransferase family 4 protein [Streptomyces sp. BE20]MEE1822783.1 glycosyltransferase family 4 protein [Streptomyces sp. BE20]
MTSTLIVTNDFPPRQGGIETFVHAMATRLPGGEVVVYTSDEPGSAHHDAALPFPVIRDRSRTLLPTGRVTRRAAEIARAYGCDRIWFGAAAPLAAMTPGLRRRAPGIRRTVATTHGHEIWWARTPGARRLLRRIGDSVDVVTYLGPYTRDRIAPALGPVARLERLVPGVDADLFRPRPGRPSDESSALWREQRGGGPTGPVILCVARLVPRKGQDSLIRALPQIRRAVPGATLVLVGRGPDEQRLRDLTRRHTEPGSVVFAGGREHAQTPAHYAAADVFAMPCRTRRAGLEAEGLGIVFLEAAASGLPVVAGRSGGAPDAVLDGVTGTVVDGRDDTAVAEAIVRILRTPAAERARTGEAGRRWVREQWSWETTARRLAALLAPDASSSTPRPTPTTDDRRPATGSGVAGRALPNDDF